MNLGTHNDDCLPHLNITHYLFQIFSDADLFQKFLGWTDKNQINIS